MERVVETSRRKAPFEKPQSVAFDGTSLWIGSIATSKVYCLNPQTLAVSHEVDAPGKPWGMAHVANEFRVICGEGADDDRFVRRLSAEGGFAGSDGFRCPDGTGSQLSFDGKQLFVSQWYNRRLLGVDDRGNVTETIGIPHQICGQTYADGAFYLVTTEDESTADYWITRVVRENGKPKIEDVAHVPFAARALAFDGKQFWTNHREAGEIVSFRLP
ncbi:MAG: hypothetical protein ACREMT_00550 [Vulcanimicrobiaceae bacterium]